MITDQLGKVLAVDDDRMNLMMLTRSLRNIGHTVATASNGREALERLAIESFDVLICDCLMPEMDGYEVLEALRADPAHKDLPVIMLSGVEDMASIVTCLELGASDYLAKPFDPALLRARLNNTLAQKRLREREAQLYDDLQRNYQKLRELEALRDSLIHMIVHDLRTPLTSVIGGLDGLATLLSIEGDAAELLDVATRGSGVLLTMIDDLLDIHRLEGGASILDRTPVDLAALLAGARDQVATLADRGGLRLVVEPPGAPVTVAADRSKLERVLVNLLGNAIKFTPAGGAIVVSTRPLADGGVAIAVEDEGEGIPADALPHVFDRFYQVASRRRGRSMSSGLGLTFCRMVVEAHGGRIEAASTLGTGSRFTFTLPPAS